MHPNLNREVRRSLTWHSSESESALERFEPVAVVQQLPDGRGTLFTLVAARRQKVFKRGKRSSFCPFSSFRTSEKNTIRKVSLRFFAGERCSTLQAKTQSTANSQNKRLKPYPLFLLHMQAQKKKLSKRKRRKKISHSAERDKGDLPLTQPPFEKGGRKL